MVGGGGCDGTKACATATAGVDTGVQLVLRSRIAWSAACRAVSTCTRVNSRMLLTTNYRIVKTQ